ncbi:EAL domain-containing protein [Pseudoduganella violacea]|uniref:Diguanylate cyclase (GGDEF)-like protein n=1 Tax=Pseudoduganella violacea TaxID=1715466 RepID=A0A7W5BFD9_9BURK|nr:EAL domain-containing protein [Pseudoduganella violacea]MBB3122098.1 diguanylate cyclase (GGDEF)-like protein [Pseudoduganella violacea]
MSAVPESARPLGKLDRLGLRQRLNLALAALALPLLVAALAALGAHSYAISAESAYQNGEQAVLLRSQQALLVARAGDMDALRALMREVAQRSSLSVLRAQAQAVAVASNDTAPQGAVRSVALQPLLEELQRLARDADAAARQQASHVATVAFVVLLAAPLIALLIGSWLAHRITAGVDVTLRECIQLASDIIAGDYISVQRARAAAVLAAASGRKKGRGATPSSEADATGKNEFTVLANTLAGVAAEMEAVERRRVEVEESNASLERARRLLQSCTETLAQGADETLLLQAVCQHLVEAGYRIAWAGLARSDRERNVELAAHAGSDRDYIAQLDLGWGHDRQRCVGAGAAIAERRTLMTSNVGASGRFAAWRTGSLPRGLGACIAIPLQHQGSMIGCLSLYSVQLQPFSAAEIAMLQAIAAALSAALHSLRAAAERQRIQEQLSRHVNYDSLTGLANRFTLESSLQKLAADSKDSSRKLAVFSVDLDRFRDVNDTLGHDHGDRMLAEVARRLEGAAGNNGVAARLGADEFVVVLSQLESATVAESAAGALLAALSRPLQNGPDGLAPSASIGISLYPDDSVEVAAALRHANLAMHDAKAAGGNTFRFYGPEMNARATARFAMEAELRRALELKELMMHYQPQVSLVNGMITGAEALMRWYHPTRGIVGPKEFIRLAEESGLLLPFGVWAIDNVCAQIAAWLREGLPVPTISVNLSPGQFNQPDLLDTVRHALERYRLEPRQLALEITESAVMRDAEAAGERLRELHALGVRLILDQFGTGQSSFSYLKRFPISHLKIDRSFVRDITTVPDDAAICNAVIALAHNLHATVVAQGVETEEQVSYLRRRNCDEIQGQFFSRALPPQGFAQLLSSNRKLSLGEVDETPHTILLLDDEANIVRALGRALRTDGYKILAAVNAEEAFRLLAVNEVQVVVSDQRMPEMSGTEFLSRVKDLYPDTIRIVLSGYADLESVIDAVNRGAIYRFFTKPWDDEQLRACIREAFRQHRIGLAVA